MEANPPTTPALDPETGLPPRPPGVIPAPIEHPDLPFTVDPSADTDPAGTRTPDAQSKR